MRVHNYIPLPDSELAAIYLQDRGACQSLAAKHGVNPSTIRRRLRSMGVSIRKNGDAQLGIFDREKNPNWGGGRTVRGDGYICVKMPDHPRADKRNGYVAEHILIAERALGRPIPDRAEIHHVNEVKTENRNDNLVICQDTAYHQLLHVRMRIRGFGGNPNTDRICCRCQRVLNKGMFGKDSGRPDGLRYECRERVRVAAKEKYARMSPEQRRRKHALGSELLHRKHLAFWQDSEDKK